MNVSQLLAESELELKSFYFYYNTILPFTKEHELVGNVAKVKNLIHGLTLFAYTRQHFLTEQVGQEIWLK
jgi:hypothetical protein